MSTATRPTTAAELMAMGEDAPYELIRGVLHEVTPKKLVHAMVSSRLAKHLVCYSDEHLAGEVLVGEGGLHPGEHPDTVLVSDVAFTRAERMSPKEERPQFGRVPPDVVVEVRSPPNTAEEIEHKVAAYLRGGVPLVWVADTERETVAAYTPDGGVQVYRAGEGIDEGEVLPGFRMPVAELFA